MKEVTDGPELTFETLASGDYIGLLCFLNMLLMKNKNITLFCTHKLQVKKNYLKNIQFKRSYLKSY